MTRLRVRTAFLVASFVIAYFLGLTYAILRAGAYFGLEAYGLLVLCAVVFGIFATRDITRLGTAFLIFFNASRIFFFCAYAALVLNDIGTVRIPIDKVGFSMVWVLPLGLAVVLNFVYYFGFSDRKQKYFFFSWVRDARQVSGAN